LMFLFTEQKFLVLIEFNLSFFCLLIKSKVTEI
jgi:hypothetical protein